MIEATEYICTPPDAAFFITTPGGGACVVRVSIFSDENGDGIRFLEWLRDKLRADQEAAKAFDRVPLGKTWDEIARDRKAEEENRRAFVLPVINEGDTAPSADVVSIAAESQFRIP